MTTNDTCTGVRERLTDEQFLLVVNLARVKIDDMAAYGEAKPDYIEAVEAAERLLETDKDQ